MKTLVNHHGAEVYIECLFCHKLYKIDYMFCPYCYPDESDSSD
jgi:RNA polymerase subunit RPABC4/transcription elongation factor Spt4